MRIPWLRAGRDLNVPLLRIGLPILKALFHTAVHLLEECLPDVREFLPLPRQQVLVLIDLVLHVQELTLALAFLLH
jgi:hypothetical protein